MPSAKKDVDNGVNVQALLDARKALTDAPEAAKFSWRATCKWVNGTHSRSIVKEFYGLGSEQRHREAFAYDADHPEIFARSEERRVGKEGRCRRSPEDSDEEDII